MQDIFRQLGAFCYGERIAKNAVFVFFVPVAYYGLVHAITPFIYKTIDAGKSRHNFQKYYITAILFLQHHYAEE
jgi:hypothetical protein